MKSKKNYRRMSPSEVINGLSCETTIVLLPMGEYKINKKFKPCVISQDLKDFLGKNPELVYTRLRIKF